MSLWSSFRGLFGRRYAPQEGHQYTGPRSGSGNPNAIVTDERAMQISTVWACVRMLSEVIGSLPLQVYKDTDDGRVVAKKHPLYRVLHDKPNTYQTAVEFRETMMMHLALEGNAYAVIDRNAQGDVVSLLPLYAGSMEVSLGKNGDVTYEYHTERGVVVYAPENILHIKLFGPGVTVGLSPLAHARQAMGLSASIENHTNRFFTNGARPGGILTIDKTLTKEQREALKGKFSDMQVGDENAFRLMVLEAGFAYSPTTINPADAQMLQQWSFSIDEICRFFRIHPLLIGSTDKVSSWPTASEAQDLFFLKYSLRPYLTRWEQAISNKLLTPADRAGGVYAEFSIEGLLRADSQARAQFYSTMVQNGLMTRNEVRKRENMPTVDGGDALTAQVNMAPIDGLGGSNGTR
jgi:HK97 family phage portal protein